MRLILLAICAIAIWVPTSADATERLAVLEFSGEALGPDKRAYLARRVRAELKSLLPADVVVVTRENVQALVDAQAGECLEEGSCAIETLRNIGADRGVEGSLVRFGDGLRLHMNLYDVGSGALVRSAEAAGLDEQHLANDLPDACRRLLGRQPSPSVGGRAGHPEGSFDALGATSLALGLGALAGALAFGLKARSTESDLRGGPHPAQEAESLMDAGRGQAATADVLAVTGVAGVAYGLWRLATRW